MGEVREKYEGVAEGVEKCVGVWREKKGDVGKGIGDVEKCGESVGNVGGNVGECMG